MSERHPGRQRGPAHDRTDAGTRPRTGHSRHHRRLSQVPQGLHRAHPQHFLCGVCSAAMLRDGMGYRQRAAWVMGKP